MCVLDDILDDVGGEQPVVRQRNFKVRRSSVFDHSGRLPRTTILNQVAEFLAEPENLFMEEISMSVTVRPRGYAKAKAARAERRRAAKRAEIIRKAQARYNAMAKELDVEPIVVEAAEGGERFGRWPADAALAEPDEAPVQWDAQVGRSPTQIGRVRLGS